MKIFPKKELKFKLIDSKEVTLERLKRRTEYSEKMTSNYTDKSFRGIVNNDGFKIISSEIGKGAFFVMSGKIEDSFGTLKLEINKAFKILFFVLITVFFLGFILQLISNPKVALILFLVLILQVILIRYLFFGFFISRMSNHSINRFRDVVDIEYLN